MPTLWWIGCRWFTIVFYGNNEVVNIFYTASYTTFWIERNLACITTPHTPPEISYPNQEISQARLTMRKKVPSSKSIVYKRVPSARSEIHIIRYLNEDVPLK